MRNKGFAPTIEKGKGKRGKVDRRSFRLELKYFSPRDRSEIGIGWMTINVLRLQSSERELDIAKMFCGRWLQIMQSVRTRKLKPNQIFGLTADERETLFQARTHQFEEWE